MGRIIDLTGQKFGKLTAIKRVGKDDRNNYLWECLCDCGRSVELKTCRLTTGHTKSCGCIKKKTNKYDISGEYGIGWDENGCEFYFDLEDYNIIKDYYWYVGLSRGKRRYVYAREIIPGHPTTLMHRFIMQHHYPDIDIADLVVDHIYHNTNDNRKSQLRLCTKSDNMRNREPSSTSNSGKNGVYWDKKNKKWYASIMLGRFENLEDAIAIREKAESIFYDGFAYKK